MATLTVRIPDDKHLRLKELAESQGISVNKLIEELSTVALVEFDTHTRFKLISARGDVAEGLSILDKLDSIEL
ncbi:toxin-antitoxin system HicB family antitoxin [Chamaesiphon sp. OTE_75_metabat_556]|uniref:toxin-antitoxin system HicB family antitoxin n=1 Tax=Chamaesiphon sp. OTE_75_metabat_556 TaxID=2964692 RepID=UPI00286A917D|nr:toxin-antitoxin system HicB family antitoxin [Chamaesiphon sp. OTE_75_metabat_556]